MCGIVAIVSREPAELAPIEAMVATLSHRGPDDAGSEVLREEGMAFGMRRLSIIDLAGGSQPMWDEGGRHGVVFNGEIYNYADLRRELQLRGHHFRTDHSDTEVLVHGFDEWGEGLFERLNGMFAFALWDRDANRLVLARDRTGEKPMYVAQLPHGYAVASELKALLAHPAVSREVDPVALEQYLAFDFVVGPRTMLHGVQKLLAGHYAFLTADRFDARPYWRLGFTTLPRAVQATVDELDRLLDRSVEMRMIADVPIGLFLSGGLDSSTIGYYMRRHSDNVESFSVGFDEPRFDESHFAALAARHLGTKHHLEVFTQETVLDLLPRVTEMLDEPMGDQSIFPTALLSAFTRRHVTVALGGDGSDELLMGYRTYQAMKLYWMLDRVSPQFLRTLAATSIRHLPAPRGGLALRALRLLHTLDLPPQRRLLSRLGSFAGDARWIFSSGVRTLLPPTVFDGVQSELSRATSLGWGPAETTIATYVRCYLQEDILVKVDRASMASSLEVRAPFLDPDLIDFFGTVPASMKMPRLARKHLLTTLMRGRLPDAIIDRPKRGFGVPLNAWLRESLSPLVREYLEPARIAAAGYFDPTAVGRLSREHLDGTADHGHQLWLLLQFELWRERWLAPPPLESHAVAGQSVL